MLNGYQQSMAQAICTKMQTRASCGDVACGPGEIRADINTLLMSMGVYADTSNMSGDDLALFLIMTLVARGALPIMQ